MKKVIVIPARLNSSRLPNKLLLKLGEKSIIQRVYEQCLKVENIDQVYIAVDDDKLLSHCVDFSKNVILTSKDHQSGTDRIAEAVEKINCDVVINVQGDEPFIDPKLIEEIGGCFTDTTVKMSSAMCALTSTESIKDPNNVKVITNSINDAIYFSRLPIPYFRDEEIDSKKQRYYKHIGLYGYTKEFLLTYAKMKPTRYEQAEKLEQLRVLENGYQIRMVTTNDNAIGIDTMEDYNNAKALLNNL